MWIHPKYLERMNGRPRGFHGAEGDSPEVVDITMLRWMYKDEKIKLGICLDGISRESHEKVCKFLLDIAHDEGVIDLL